MQQSTTTSGLVLVEVNGCFTAQWNREAEEQGLPVSMITTRKREKLVEELFEERMLDK